MVILVDRETASAAEVLAAALRDLLDAVIVGERTAGKGVGQKAMLLPDGSGLSFTRFQILSPSGASWDGIGLAPRIPVHVPAGTPAGRDAALEAARAYLQSLAAGGPAAIPSSPS